MNLQQAIGAILAGKPLERKARNMDIQWEPVTSLMDPLDMTGYEYREATETPVERLRKALTESFPNCPPPPGEITPKYLHELASYLYNLDSHDPDDGESNANYRRIRRAEDGHRE